MFFGEIFSLVWVLVFKGMMVIVGLVVCKIVCLVVILRLWICFENGVCRFSVLVCLVKLDKLFCVFVIFCFVCLIFERILVWWVEVCCVRLRLSLSIWFLKVVFLVLSVVSLFFSFVILCCKVIMFEVGIMVFVISVFWVFKFFWNRFKCVFSEVICVLVVINWCCNVVWCFCSCFVWLV